MVVGREYILHAARALLNSAEQATDPQRAAELAQEAAELLALVDEIGRPTDPAELH
jgi:hypothetical protein